jgi:hypothetical protein
MLNQETEINIRKIRHLLKVVLGIMLLLTVLSAYEAILRSYTYAQNSWSTRSSNFIMSYWYISMNIVINVVNVVLVYNLHQNISIDLKNRRITSLYNFFKGHRLYFIGLALLTSFEVVQAIGIQIYYKLQTY